ncbi:MAG: glycoside hydrolase family 48 protein [Nibricoccus sp.]
MKKYLRTLAATLGLACIVGSTAFSQQNTYEQRFLDLRAKIVNPANGYFSKDGVPYHSVETLICEAPDHGHETTSEAYSYWLWLEVMNGRITGNWTPLNNAWTKMEAYAIPTSDLQPTTGSYNPNAPATFAREFPLPNNYPSPLESTVPVGVDPVSPDLTAAYGSNIYGMHWLFDCDNFYGYGKKGDGVSTPSYINTFQRGEQESVWETVPHPSWENFKWGSNDGTGFLRLFISETSAPAAQWRYTNAPDADARAVQAIYWGVQFARNQGLNPATTLPVAKAAKMGDFIRLAMFDKYFKPIGSQSKTGPGGTGYNSAHYLLSWYYAWGGPLTSQGWAWRIGCSHNHFGYQNPLAAYALSATTDLRPASTNGARDWGQSLTRQLEFYQWLQSAEGAIAGGATNSLNGNYDPYPSGTPTFYGMAYQENPVYHDPGSNTWFGMQAWSMERVAEYYYVSNNARAKAVLDKWIAWAKSVVQLTSDGGFQIPSEIGWSGAPNTWVPASPTANTGLHVNVASYGTDLGIAAALAQTFTYYAAATQRWGTLDTASRDLAQQILDRMWTKYYEPNGKGVAVTESRADFRRFFDQTVYIPTGWSGKMANGDVIVPGVKFIDIRSKYRSDPDWAALVTAYNSGTDYKKAYHRFWAQASIAIANAEYGRFFGTPVTNVPVTGVTVAPTSATVNLGSTTTLVATVSPSNATNKAVTWTSNNPAVASVSNSGVVTGSMAGSTMVTVTTQDGGFTASSAITVTNVVVPVTGVTVAPTSASVNVGATTTLTATVSPSNATNKTVTWSSSNTSVATVNSSGVVTGVAAGSATITATTQSGGFTASSAITVTPVATTPCANPVAITLSFAKDGAGEFCWETSGTINYVNSWNLQLLEINGVNYTNRWSNSMPAKINGKYYIHYVGSFPWSHFEANGSQ